MFQDSDLTGENGNRETFNRKILQERFVDKIKKSYGRVNSAENLIIDPAALFVGLRSKSYEGAPELNYYSRIYFGHFNNGDFNDLERLDLDVSPATPGNPVLDSVSITRMGEHPQTSEFIIFEKLSSLRNTSSTTTPSQESRMEVHLADGTNPTMTSVNLSITNHEDYSELHVSNRNTVIAFQIPSNTDSISIRALEC